ncbi:MULTISPECIES: fimbrial protein [Enterobacter cloacae complex]|uniref:fimbrial protein n=1 Tax=Enterobacter cloacae complex TaxID=354276 RepID=UPI001874BEC5|nr:MULTISPECIES: fimbrial protein [Enterobacter cloacae complex]MBE4895983.1 fimbrial protein [Enterobacter cloacae complex sp. P16RS2]
MMKNATILFCAFIFFSRFSFGSECRYQPEGGLTTIPISFRIPDDIQSKSIGTVLFRKEATLTELTGKSKDLTSDCIAKASQVFTGRLPDVKSGNNVFKTRVDGVGIRITVVFSKKGVVHKELFIPFAISLGQYANKQIKTDDISIRLELVKIGNVETQGVETFNIPDLLTLNDGSFIAGLAVKIAPASPHCAIKMNAPQVVLTAVKTSQFKNSPASPPQPVEIGVECINTTHASISIEGMSKIDSGWVLENLLKEKASSGVGIELLYDGKTIIPHQIIDIGLSKENQSKSLPFTARYLKIADEVKAGEVKTQFTLRLDYL